MKRAFGAARLRGACAFVLLLAGLLSMPVAATDVDDIGRAVYAAVFEGVAPAAGVGGASPEYRLFRQRYGKTELTADPESGDWEESVVQNKRRSVERLVFAFGAGRSTAVRVSRSIPLALEWEGMADGPLAEARAAQTLAGDPSVAKAYGFLVLFSAHRYRAAAEAATFQGLVKEQEDAKQGYRKQLALALAANDPLIRAAARVLAGKTRVYYSLPEKP